MSIVWLPARWLGRLRVAVAIGVTVLVLAFLWAPPPPVPKLQIPHLDKYVHLGLFFAAALSWRFAGMPALRVAVFGVALGIVTEIVQGALPWPRTPDALDVVADAVGIAIAIAIAAASSRIVRR